VESIIQQWIKMLLYPAAPNFLRMQQ